MSDVVEKSLRKVGITVSKPVLAVICIVFGILLIIFPPLVAYIIGIFLVIQGILLLTEYMEINRQQQPRHPYPPFSRNTACATADRNHINTTPKRFNNQANQTLATEEP
ncbi:MAG: DUF308 domain-containing protein [Candidatus Bathyarchaeota archaeon]|nr:DUF308 domain-containing protein [Candidatus Bathyarchaeota archaeon]